MKRVAILGAAIALVSPLFAATSASTANAEPSFSCAKFTNREGGRTYYNVLCSGLNSSYRYRAVATCNRLGVKYTAYGAWRVPKYSINTPMSTAICGLLSTMEKRWVQTKQV